MRTASSPPDDAAGRAEPFVGPRPFGEDDADRFFGRTAVTEELFALVSAFQTCVVYGESGTGKSSLIYAGLMPTARAAGMEVLPVARVQGAGVEGWTGQGNPFVHYTLASWRQWEKWPEPPADEPTEISVPLSAPHDKDAYGDPTIRLAVFDQFEELFTAFPGHWEDRVPFLNDLARALREDRRLRLVFVVREDHLADVLDAVAELPDGLKAHLRLPRLDGDEAIEAIEGPVHRLTSIGFADGVVKALVTDLMTIKVRRGTGAAGETIGEYVEPVQLQVVCSELWRSLPDGTKVVTTDQVAKIGDPTSALARFYDNCVAETARHAAVSAPYIRRWFERVLITPAGTRASAWQGDHTTAGMPNAAVAELESKHMLRAEDRAGAPLVRDHPRPVHRGDQKGGRRGPVAVARRMVGHRGRFRRRRWTRRGLLLAARGLARATLMLVGLLLPALGVTAAIVRTLDGQMPPLGIKRRWWWLWGTIAALAAFVVVGGIALVFGSGSGSQPNGCTVSAFSSYEESARGVCFGGARAVIFGWGLAAGICIGLLLGILWRMASTRRRNRRRRKMSRHPAGSAPSGPPVSEPEDAEAELASAAPR